MCNRLDLNTLKISTNYGRKSPWTLPCKSQPPRVGPIAYANGDVGLGYNVHLRYVGVIWFVSLVLHLLLTIFMSSKLCCITKFMMKPMCMFEKNYLTFIQFEIGSVM